MMRYLTGLWLLMIFTACSPAITSTSQPSPPATPTASPDLALTLGLWHKMIYHEQGGGVVLVNGGPERASQPR